MQTEKEMPKDDRFFLTIVCESVMANKDLCVAKNFPFTFFVLRFLSCLVYDLNINSLFWLIEFLVIKF